MLTLQGVPVHILYSLDTKYAVCTLEFECDWVLHLRS